MASAFMKLPRALAREPREPERRARLERNKLEVEVYTLLELGFPAA